jgi:hypothetical protein
MIPNVCQPSHAQQTGPEMLQWEVTTTEILDLLVDLLIIYKITHQLIFSLNETLWSGFFQYNMQ